MVTVKVLVTADCEALLHSMPRGHEYELTDEDYCNKDGSGVVTFIIHDVDEMTYAMDQALNANDGVVKYKEIR